MSHAENFSVEDDFIRVNGLPLLKRLERKNSKVEVLDILPSDGVIPPGYRWSSRYEGYVKTGWTTEPKIGTRADFPIPRWEPGTDTLINWINQAEEAPGGYRWLFPSSKRPKREESSGIQRWVEERFSLEARAWVSPERAYEKVRSIGERIGAKEVIGSHVYDHWFRSQRASQLAQEYGLRENHLNRFFGWAGGWTTSRGSMAARYARTGYGDLCDRMRLGRDRVERQHF